MALWKVSSSVSYTILIPITSLPDCLLIQSCTSFPSQHFWIRPLLVLGLSGCHGFPWVWVSYILYTKTTQDQYNLISINYWLCLICSWIQCISYILNQRSLIIVRVESSKIHFCGPCGPRPLPFFTGPT